MSKTYWDENGSQTSHKYVLDGTNIIKETIGNDVLYYFYDAAGSIAGFEYNGTLYYYQKNLQGDIVRICDVNGTTVTEYTYDAWGKVLSVTGSLANTVGKVNPFRYRGCYYDAETGYYYLQTRYYDPEVGRFLNADCIIGANGDIPGYNMFAYCSNNPVVRVDPSGNVTRAVFRIQLEYSGASFVMPESNTTNEGVLEAEAIVGARWDAMPEVPSQIQKEIDSVGKLQYYGNTLSTTFCNGRFYSEDYLVFSFCQPAKYNNQSCFIISSYYFTLADSDAIYGDLKWKSELYYSVADYLNFIDLGPGSSGVKEVDLCLMAAGIIAWGCRERSESLKQRASQYANGAEVWELHHVIASFNCNGVEKLSKWVWVSF